MKYVYKILDDVIYLYEITGDSKNALALTTKELTISFDDLFSDNDVINEDKLKKFNSNLNLCISVCESNSESNSESNKEGFSFKNLKESYDLWFNVLNACWTFSDALTHSKLATRLSVLSPFL